MPKKNQLKTIKQLADELNLEKKRVEYQVSKLRDDLVPKLGGVRYLTNEAESIIREKLGFKELPTLGTDSGSYSVVDYQLEILEKELQYKSNQLKEKDKQLDSKDKQLESKDKQLEQLHKLLDQQQQLQLATNRQIEQLQQQNQLLLSDNHPYSKENDDTDTGKQHNNINDSFNLNDYPKTIERRRRKRELREQRLNQDESNQPKEILRKKWWKIW